MFKKSKKTVAVTLLAGALIFGAGAASADYFFGVKTADNTSYLSGKISDLSATLKKVTQALTDAKNEIANANKKHDADMKTAESAVAKANAEIVKANAAIAEANTNINATDADKAAADSEADAVNGKTGVIATAGHNTWGGIDTSSENAKVATTGAN